jgi:hypothetical protein
MATTSCQSKQQKKTPQKAGPVQQGVWHSPLTRDRVQLSFGKSVSEKKEKVGLIDYKRSGRPVALTSNIGR